MQRKVKNARVLARIAPAEAAELSWFGAEVIHPFTMEHVVKAQVPIRIKNTLNPSAPGTLIDPTADYVKEPLAHNRYVRVDNDLWFWSTSCVSLPCVPF